MDKIKITKENYKGYIELYEHNEYLDFPGLKILKATLVSISVWLILTAVISSINAIGFNLMIYGSITICCEAISSAVANRIKIKKELKKKYPFIDYSIKQKELEEILTKNNLLYHNKQTNTYVIYKSGDIKLFEEEKQNKIASKHKVQEAINFSKNQNILSSELQEEKVKVKTLGSR